MQRSEVSGAVQPIYGSLGIKGLIVSTYYILCISWIVKCLIIIDARCKHEDNLNYT